MGWLDTITFWCMNIHSNSFCWSVYVRKILVKCQKYRWLTWAGLVFPYVVSFSGLSIFFVPSVFSNVYFQIVMYVNVGTAEISLWTDISIFTSNKYGICLLGLKYLPIQRLTVDNFLSNVSHLELKLKLTWEVIVRYVEIDGIKHCLNVLFVIFINL